MFVLLSSLILCRVALSSLSANYQIFLQVHTNSKYKFIVIKEISKFEVF